MKIVEIPNSGLILGYPLVGTWLRYFGNSFYTTLLFFKKPNFISFQMHCWDGITFNGPYAKNSGPGFLEKLKKMLEYLEDEYHFVCGESIAKNFRDK